MSTIRNHMQEDRRLLFFALRGRCRKGKLSTSDPLFTELRREYDRNRPRAIARKARAAMRRAAKSPPLSLQPGYAAARSAAWRKANPERLRVLCQKSYRKCRERVIARAVAYERKRMQCDPLFKYTKAIRCRLHKAIRSGKSGLAVDLVGCSRDKLIAHIESMFKPGMTWANWSLHGWHIDHIRPVSAFNLTNEDERRACFHYTNLQPLWAAENLMKSAKDVSRAH